jgi:hypothetical protein
LKSKPKKKSASTIEPTFTVSNFADLHGLDRRTLTRRLFFTDTKPVRVDGRYRFYTETQLRSAMHDAGNAGQSQRSIPEWFTYRHVLKGRFNAGIAHADFRLGQKLPEAIQTAAKLADLKLTKEQSATLCLSIFLSIVGERAIDEETETLDVPQAIADAAAIVAEPSTPTFVEILTQ